MFRSRRRRAAVVPVPRPRRCRRWKRQSPTCRQRSAAMAALRSRTPLMNFPQQSVCSLSVEAVRHAVRTLLCALVDAVAASRGVVARARRRVSSARTARPAVRWRASRVRRTSRALQRQAMRLRPMRLVELRPKVARAGDRGPAFRAAPCGARGEGARSRGERERDLQVADLRQARLRIQA